HWAWTRRPLSAWPCSPSQSLPLPRRPSLPVAPDSLPAARSSRIRLKVVSLACTYSASFRNTAKSVKIGRLGHLGHPFAAAAARAPLKIVTVTAARVSPHKIKDRLKFKSIHVRLCQANDQPLNLEDDVVSADAHHFVVKAECGTAAHRRLMNLVDACEED